MCARIFIAVIKSIESLANKCAKEAGVIEKKDYNKVFTSSYLLSPTFSTITFPFVVQITGNLSWGGNAISTKTIITLHEELFVLCTIKLSSY